MYEVKFYRGNYRERQRAANADECAGYVEHHFNSSASEAAGYAMVVVGSNASQTSKNWGRWYAQAVANEFDIRVGADDGIKVGGWNGRGDHNIKYTNMPALLVEPLFASNPQHAQWIRSDSGQLRLAQVLDESVRRFFPAGGLIGFSVGHKYKTSRPNDRGAAVVGGGTEADYAEMVMEKAQALLEVEAPEDEARTIRVMRNSEILQTFEIDDDADVRWDAERGVLHVLEQA